MDVRRTLTSAAVALAGAAAVTAGGWTLQAAALPPPAHADRVAADASAWLHDYRLVVDVFHVDHRRLTGACLRGWFSSPDGTKTRMSLLSVGSGTIFRLPEGRRVSTRTGAPGHPAPVGLMALAGCSAKLSSALAAAAQYDRDLRVERSYAANRPTLALKLERRHDERLTLYVSPKTYLPIVAIVQGDGHTATARLYLNQITPHLLSRFRFPAERRRKPRP